jgi:hypothetical protein
MESRIFRMLPTELASDSERLTGGHVNNIIAHGQIPKASV